MVLYVVLRHLSLLKNLVQSYYCLGLDKQAGADHPRMVHRSLKASHRSLISQIQPVNLVLTIVHTKAQCITVTAALSDPTVFMLQAVKCGPGRSRQIVWWHPVGLLCVTPWWSSGVGGHVVDLAPLMWMSQVPLVEDTKLGGGGGGNKFIMYSFPSWSSCLILFCIMKLWIALIYLFFESRRKRVASRLITVPHSATCQLQQNTMNFQGYFMV